MGQPCLMMAYEKAFDRYGQKVAQILITRDDLNHRRRYLNARNTIFTLLSWRIIPMINENDTVSVDEIKFGDNDNLSAMVTNLTEAQLLVNLTEHGRSLRQGPPQRTGMQGSFSRGGEGIRDVIRVRDRSPGAPRDRGNGEQGQGGQKVSLAGVPSIIANGLRQGVLMRILSRERRWGRSSCPRRPDPLPAKALDRLHQLEQGEIAVDRGAEKALLKGGKSLLPSGITGCERRIRRGRLGGHSERGSDRSLAVGMVNYDSGDIRKIMGVQKQPDRIQAGVQARR